MRTRLLLPFVLAATTVAAPASAQMVVTDPGAYTRMLSQLNQARAQLAEFDRAQDGCEVGSLARAEHAEHELAEVHAAEAHRQRVAACRRVGWQRFTAAGDYTLRVTPTDKAGNTSSASVSFKLDTSIAATTVALADEIGRAHV